MKTLIAIITLGLLPGIIRAAEPTPKYLDPQVPIEERIDDLLPRMTLEEKVIELSDSWGSQGIPRLKIPAMLKTEGLHGQSYSSGATIFPQSIAMAATFDQELVKRVGKATAEEAKAANLRCTWSPVLDVARDARWGRVEETYGEDPYLVSRMGVAWISGFQGENMIAVPKHFAGHGEPLGGRDSHDAQLSDRAMRSTHLVSFRAAIKEAHAGGVMAAYSTWNGVPDNGSTELLQKILREEWDFDGFVVSDCGGPENFLTKQSVVQTTEEAAAKAVLAGVDIECGSTFNQALAKAVHDGFVQESQLDLNVRRVLRAKFRLGLFENPGSAQMVWDKLPAYDTPEHRALAREVSVQSSVLLKNDDHLLPLSKTIRQVAVIGPNADEAQTGDYSPKALDHQLVTVLQGVRSHVSAGTKVLYARGCDQTSDSTSGIAEAVNIAKQADVVILVVGDRSRPEGGKSTTGENTDGATLEIPGVQRQLIKEVQATGKPVVLVLVNGKPFTLPWEADNIMAILETWYPGEEGGNATADLLFGDRNPSGRLPITFPRHVGQLPLTYDYLPSGRNYRYYDMPFTPLYRFGYGLSYTRFQYSHLTITPKTDDPGFVHVSVDVANVGERDGDEAVQLYVTDMLAPVITPVIELKGVQHVSLKRGETKTVDFELTPYELSFLDADLVRKVAPAKFRIHVGGSSPKALDSGDQQKNRIGFKDPAEGVSGEFEVTRPYQADFVCALEAPDQARGGEPLAVTVTVTNQGNLLDVADVKLYCNRLLDTHRFEIEPGQSRSHTFETTLYESGQQTLLAMVDGKVVYHSLQVSNVPVNLLLSHVRTALGDDGVLHYAAEAFNAGSQPYKKDFAITVDDQVAATQALDLKVGEHCAVKLDCPFPFAGTFQVKIGDGAGQPMTVPGGIGLALRDPLVYLDFDSPDNAGVRNEVTGTVLPVQGAPRFVTGKHGRAFRTDDKQTFIKAGSLDLYRKSFTLAAWVNIESLENKQATFFGGAAPMGADIDVIGTSLAASVFDNRLLLTFRNRDTQGRNSVPLGHWIHVAYTYNAEREQGAVYLDGELDHTETQPPYAGPLEMIGSAPELYHGKFAMDEVLVTRSTMDSRAIHELAARGVESLRTGSLTTEWRSAASALASLQTWAEIPSRAAIKVTVETADKSFKVTDSKSFTLQSGEREVALTGIKPGAQVRLRAELTSSKWGGLPLLRGALLTGPSDSLRWSTVGEWSKGSATGGLKVGP